VGLARRWRRDCLVAEPFGGAHVGAVAQHPAECRAGPHRASGRRGDAFFVEAARDRSHRPASGGVLVEDSADDRRFGLVNLQAGRALRGAGDAPVAVWDLPEDRLAGTHPEQLPTPVALRDFRPLVLCDHALHLGQQPRLGIVVDRGRVGEAHLAAKPVEFVEHQHLIRVGARETIGRQAPHSLDHARLCSIT
jgi:hypothetical protein